mgnify:CR=1 FL=1
MAPINRLPQESHINFEGMEDKPMMEVLLEVLDMILYNSICI